MVKVLKKYFKLFIKNFKAEQLSVYATKGEGQMADLGMSDILVLILSSVLVSPPHTFTHPKSRLYCLRLGQLLLYSYSTPYFSFFLVGESTGGMLLSSFVGDLMIFDSFLSFFACRFLAEFNVAFSNPYLIPLHFYITPTLFAF